MDDMREPKKASTQQGLEEISNTFWNHDGDISDAETVISDHETDTKELELHNGNANSQDEIATEYYYRRNVKMVKVNFWL